MSLRHLIPETAGLINAARSVAPIVAVASEDGPRAGVTTVSCNLAMELVGIRRSVAVVDGDFGNPQLHKRLDQPLGAGLAAVLAGEAEIEQVFNYRPAGRGKCLAITAGEQHVRRASLLLTPPAEQAVQRLSELADIVLLNCAPLTTKAGQALIALADSVVLVGSAPLPMGLEQRPPALLGSSPYVAARVADPEPAAPPRVSGASAPEWPSQPTPQPDDAVRHTAGRRPAPVPHQAAAAAVGTPDGDQRIAATSSRAVLPRLRSALPKTLRENAGLRKSGKLPPALAAVWEDDASPRKRRFYSAAEDSYLD